MLSRLVWWKRVERGIEAMPSVLRTCPDTLLLIVGDGVERSRLERLANDLGLANYVRFTSAVSRQEIKSYLAAADIFLSLYTLSNVGNPLLEAMLAGKCIVTLATGDTARVVQHDETGVLLEEEDLSWLPEELIALLKNPARRADLGANAREYAHRHFLTWMERTSMEITEVEELVDKHNQGIHQAAAQ
jgi:glycosyltransferase involved in cell wall biosynthesis